MEIEEKWHIFGALYVYLLDTGWSCSHKMSYLEIKVAIEN